MWFRGEKFNELGKYLFTSELTCNAPLLSPPERCIEMARKHSEPPIPEGERERFNSLACACFRALTVEGARSTLPTGQEAFARELIKNLLKGLVKDGILPEGNATLEYMREEADLMLAPIAQPAGKWVVADGEKTRFRDISGIHLRSQRPDNGIAARNGKVITLSRAPT